MKQLVITNRVTNRETVSFNQYLKDISEIAVFTPKDEMICAEKASHGDKKAMDELVQRNLRFVVSVAKQYATPLNPLEDLVNEGNIGLIIASKRFDPTTGYKFISYAVWWIRKIILEYLAKNGRLVRLPSNKINSLNKLDKKINELEQKLGRNVDIQEIIDVYGEELGLASDESPYKKLSDEYEFLDVLNGYSVDSLDREISNDNGNSTCLGDTLSDDTTFKATDHGVMESSVKSEVAKMLDTLKPRDKYIMVALYGLDGNIPRSLKDLGDEIGVTREMIRQIREKNLLKLKKRLLHSNIRNA